METKKITFAEHKEITAKDCEEIARIMSQLATDVREGNLHAFEDMWITGGTEEGDAKIVAIREMLCLRYVHRQENISK